MRGVIFVLASSFLVSWHNCYSQSKQENNNFIAPLSGNLGVTGSFGEIRGDHFHSGVDLRTDGVIGKELYATNDGYISRIKVSSVGYGKSIFIDHSNGLTSGYGHLNRYNDKITEYVKRIQYQQKSFDVDIFPKPYELPVKKGELIAFSGNSGGSSGPHLHYELRTTVDQQIISPAPKYLSIADSVPPTIRALYIYQIDSSSFSNGYKEKVNIPIHKTKDGYITDIRILAHSKIGLGLDIMDRINSLSTQCGFNSISVKVNGKQTYKLVFNKFAFAETKYVNSVIDYAAKIENDKEIVKLFVESANYFSGIERFPKRGFIEIIPDSIYKIEVSVSDTNGNTSLLSFEIQGVQKPLKQKSCDFFPKNIVLLSCAIDNSVINDTFILQIPRNSLYDNLYFEHSTIDNKDYKYSPLVKLHSQSVPLHIKAKLAIKSSNIPSKYQSKALLAFIDNSKTISAVYAEWKDGLVKGSISGFGNYFVALDTVAPEIIPINIRLDANLANSSSIRIVVKDDFSGVGKIDGYIDGKWALFDYDKKNNLIQYLFDKDRITKGTNHTLELVAKDTKDNTSRFNCNFVW